MNRLADIAEWVRTAALVALGFAIAFALTEFLRTL